MARHSVGSVCCGDVEDGEIVGVGVEYVTRSHRCGSNHLHKPRPCAAEVRERRRWDAFPVERALDGGGYHSFDVLEAVRRPQQDAGPIRQTIGLLDKRSRYLSFGVEPPVTPYFINPKLFKPNPEAVGAEVILESQELGSFVGSANGDLPIT